MLKLKVVIYLKHSLLPEVASQSNQNGTSWLILLNLKAKPETTIIEDKAAPHGLGVPGGQTKNILMS